MVYGVNMERGSSCMCLLSLLYVPKPRYLYHMSSSCLKINFIMCFTFLQSIFAVPPTCPWTESEEELTPQAAERRADFAHGERDTPPGGFAEFYGIGKRDLSSESQDFTE